MNEVRRRILWVDDEIEHLRSHILFLSEKGYDIESASNGEDALELLAGEPFDLVLLDEQMPGRGGVSVLKELRVHHPHLPVVMVTKSEEEEVMNQAIGRRVDGYLVKPVNPVQVLSSVRRLLEGRSMVQQRASIDFVETFRALDARRGRIGSWEEWAAVYREALRWEIELNRIGERALSGSLQELQRDLRADFSRWVMENYEMWLGEAEPGARPVLSHDLVSRYLAPLLRKQGKCLFVVIDCLRLDQWMSIAPIIAEDFEIEESPYFSILPTATPYSRNAIFSGLLPLEMERRYPDRWTGDFREERSLNRHENFFLEEQSRRLGLVKPGTVRLEKVFTADEGTALLKRAREFLRSPLTAVVISFIDLLTHGRSESEILMEIAPDEDAFRQLTRQWFRRSALHDLLREARRAGTAVLLTSDHGSVHCHRPATVFAKRDASTNLRYKFGENVRAEKDLFLSVREPAAIGLPRVGVNVNYLFATEDYYFVYPTKLREYQARYLGSFLHGGISPEEMILPVVRLTPR